MTNSTRTPSAHTHRHATPQPEAPLARPFDALVPRVQKAVRHAGYDTPTPIQEQCIPHVLDGRDVLGCAQTGTGKTAAFALPLLDRLSRDQRSRRKGTPRALILAPTRELAAQIGESLETYGRYVDISHTVVFGGVKQGNQVRALSRGIDVLVATPGRLLDLMGQGYIHLESVEFFVLDEVDRMLDMGFIHDIRKVLAKIPEQRQTLFFSATLPANIVDLADSMVVDPVRVSITPEAPTVEKITQQVLFVGKRDKDKLLVKLLGDDDISKVIVFTQMKHVANRVVKKLAASGIDAAAIHGNKSQGARTRALNGFKRGMFRVLVATDVAARGLDVDDITHVINYDLPMEAETYVHRIGRTARAGADGDAISFCTADERAYLRDIEKLLGASVPVETDHAYHCDEAFRSTRPAPTRQQGRQRQARSRRGGFKSGGQSRQSRSRSGGRSRRAATSGQRPGR